MEHHFNTAIAKKFGVNVAIFLNHMSFWIQKNMVNERHYHDGRYWTYNSQNALLKIFPYWTRQNLRTVLKQAIDADLIVEGNYNKTAYDHTTWYAFTLNGLSLFPELTPPEEANQSNGWNQPIECAKSTNLSVEINQPIPVNNTVNKTYINNNPVCVYEKKEITTNQEPKNTTPVIYQETYFKASEKDEGKPIDLLVDQDNPHKIPIEMIKDWAQSRKAKKSPLTVTAWKKVNKELSKCKNPIAAFEEMVARGWVSIKSEWVTDSKGENNTGHFDYQDKTWADKRDLFD